MVADSSTQRILRLTPLSTVLALVDSRVGAVAPRQYGLAAALGRTLAEDVVAPLLPPSAIALRDGYAVAAAAIADAGPYTPVPFAALPQRVDAGEPLPSGVDAVVPLDAVTLRGHRAEAMAAVSPGEGVLPAGGDAAPQRPLRGAGQHLRSVDCAVIAAAGIKAVTIRSPSIRILRGHARNSALVGAALEFLARAVTAAGGSMVEAHDGVRTFDDALADHEADAVIAVGGTGSGRQDGSVRALKQFGRLAVHGIAVSPGESAAFGFVGARPVLLVPGRLDAALAIWLLIGRRLLARLAGGSVDDTPVLLPLKRKVTSTIGLAELIPVICDGGVAEPLASGYLSFESLTQSEGWIVVPGDSEGFAAGTVVAMQRWP
jgi:molybdopterin molybdotransferase